MFVYRLKYLGHVWSKNEIDVSEDILSKDVLDNGGA